MAREKIAFVILNNPMIFPPTMNAAGILAEQGFEVDIFALRFNRGGDEIDIPDCVNINYVGDLKGGFYFRFIFIKMIIKIVESALKNNYKWIFSYNMTAVIPGYLASKFSQSKFLYHNHDDTVVKDKYGFYPFLKRMEYRWARKANVVSYPQQKRAEDFCENAKLYDLPLIVKNGPRDNWCDNGDATDFLSLKQQFDKLLIYQGGLNWERGIKNIIDIFSNIKGNVGLVLIGKTDNDAKFKKELERYLVDLKLSNKVVVLPVMNYSKLAGLTKNCDIGFGVMMNEADNKSYNVKYLAGASNKLVEYMACGLGSIVPNTKEYVDYVSSKGIGLVVSPNEPKESAQIIEEILFDDEKLNRMKHLALENFTENESFDKQFAKILKRINE